MSRASHRSFHDFIRDNTVIAHAPLVPEIALHLASEVLPLWQMTEAELDQSGLPPPYWAFAWAGGQALARYILDNPQSVSGKRAFDFGAGSGLVAITAKKSGAAHVAASEIDSFACAAIALNAKLNHVVIDIAARDLVGESVAENIILLGDMFYEKPLADRLADWLAKLARSGAEIFLGDPGRSYFPRRGLVELARYSVPTTRALEDSDLRSTGVFRLTVI